MDEKFLGRELNRASLDDAMFARPGAADPVRWLQRSVELVQGLAVPALWLRRSRGGAPLPWWRPTVHVRWPSSARAEQANQRWLCRGGGAR